jgi:hypothetical protein
LSLNNFIIEVKLEYLVQTETGFSNLAKNLRIEIPVHRTISIAEDYKPSVKSKPENFIVNIENIAPPLEKDIISATKVSVYHQCPAKYLLTYEYGFGKLNNLLMQNNGPYLRIADDDFEIEREYKEEEIPVSRIQADVKGTLIHALLEKEISLDEMNDEIIKYFRKSGLGEKEITNYKKGIVFDMKKFLMSDIYREISSYPDYRNEYELYIKFEESFLYGIMDKIIFSGNELIIVDYKTDDISEDDVDKRAETYFTQLKFYLFIAKKLFSNYNSFRLILIFIKHPDKPVIKKLDNDQFFLVKKEISDIIKGIIHKNFYKNTEHCGICIYSNENKECILNSDSERDIL